MGAAVKEVVLYGEPRCEHVDSESLAAYLGDRLEGIKVSARGPFFEQALEGGCSGRTVNGEERLTERIAAARIRRVNERVEGGQLVLPGEVAFEARRLRDRESLAFGLVYDAELLSEAAAAIMEKRQCSLDRVNIVLTNQLIGTWDAADNRYHARVVYCGSPAFVSVPGLAVAPAREREYYLARQGAAMLGLKEGEREEVAAAHAGDFLEIGDRRATEVLKGYVMQPVAYRMTGEVFCDDRACRLFNAHWQREMIAAQLKEGKEYCSRHQKMFGNRN